MTKRCFIILILLGFLLPVFPVPVQAQPSQLFSAENAFGYTVDDTLTFGDYWEDISITGIPVAEYTGTNQIQLDDEFSGVIPLGFNFPFFENTYSQVYASTNGYLTFEYYFSEIYSSSSVIPGDFAPNNIIAPFWDDFFVNTSGVENHWAWEVYYKAEGNQTRIQWNKVLKRGEEESSNYNSFQVILTNSGDIYFVYENLLSSILNEATVGIEGPDGIDGVEYLYHQDGLTSNSVIKFTYPGPGVHLKIKPLYQSAFIENQETIFDLTLFNTGTVDSPFNLEKSLDGGQDWTVQFFDENLNPLTDSTGDGIVDTGILGARNSKLIKVKISSPENSVIGEFCKDIIRATSMVDPSRKFEVVLQAANAAPFLLGLNDNAAGVIAQVTTLERQFDQDVGNYFTGASLSLAAVNDQRYLFAWEELKGFYKNIQFALFNTTSSTLPKIIELEDNTDKPVSVKDSSPAIAAKNGNQIAIAYIRNRYTLGLEIQLIDSNSYFVWLDQQGNHIVSPINISQNSNPQYAMEAPSIAVNSNSYAFLVWDKRNTVNQNTDMVIAVYDQDGDVIHTKEQITDSQSDNLNYLNPMVTALSSNKFLLTYYVFDNISKEFSIRYQIFNQDGSVYKTERTINNSYGRGQDVVQLPGSNILIAWTNTNSNRIAYVMLNAEGDLLSAGPVDLDSPDNREMGVVSVTYDEFGHGILTWGDEDWSDYLYYALLDGSGNIITPPMRFRKGLDPSNPTLFSSYTGQGNAPIIGDLQWTINLPLLTR
ncbi:MAG: hypothetical protein CL609_20080 [Anaerolineaceae bacterium]|nr:hypothetical protein [Anaerolineaceae bacterium]